MMVWDKKKSQAKYRAKNRELLAAKHWEFRAMGKEDKARRNKLQQIKRASRPPEKATELTKAMVATVRHHIPRSGIVLREQIAVIKNEITRQKKQYHITHHT